ncbi:MAG: hypothetical protein IJP54_03055 [Synergistaceae bacterium]|nr:hypothetical protein [Synergistaceae bacterium]MBR0034635.1 hypothetical protein [Synergistaceae bacterium]
MGTAKTESTKPVLSLSAVSLFMGGSYFFGDRFGEQCIFHMNLAGAAALGTWLFCVVGSGVI